MHTSFFPPRWHAWAENQCFGHLARILQRWASYTATAVTVLPLVDQHPLQKTHWKEVKAIKNHLLRHFCGGGLIKLPRPIHEVTRGTAFPMRRCGLLPQTFLKSGLSFLTTVRLKRRMFSWDTGSDRVVRVFTQPEPPAQIPGAWFRPGAGTDLSVLSHFQLWYV